VKRARSVASDTFATSSSAIAAQIERAPRLETLSLRAMYPSERRLDPPQDRARPCPVASGTRLLERPLGLLVPFERRERFALSRVRRGTPDRSQDPRHARPRAARR
jgi:hypothetical protein